jgi:hypothetical protein
MKIHKLSDKEITSLKIPLEKYEENLKFKEFKAKATEFFGIENKSMIKYLLIIYVIIDLYRVSNKEDKNLLMKGLEKLGLTKETILNIDKYIRYGLPASYLFLLFNQ